MSKTDTYVPATEEEIVDLLSEMFAHGLDDEEIAESLASKKGRASLGVQVGTPELVGVLRWFIPVSTRYPLPGPAEQTIQIVESHGSVHLAWLRQGDEVLALQVVEWLQPGDPKGRRPFPFVTITCTPRLSGARRDRCFTVRCYAFGDNPEKACFTDLDGVSALMARVGFSSRHVSLYARRSGWEVRGLVDPQKPYSAGTPVWARGGSKAEGFLTGTQRLCNLEGCTGVRLSVRWPKEGQRDRSSSQTAGIWSRAEPMTKRTALVALLIFVGTSVFALCIFPLCLCGAGTGIYGMFSVPDLPRRVTASGPPTPTTSPAPTVPPTPALQPQPTTTHPPAPTSTPVPTEEPSDAPETRHYAPGTVCFTRAYSEYPMLEWHLMVAVPADECGTTAFPADTSQVSALVSYAGMTPYAPCYQRWQWTGSDGTAIDVGSDQALPWTAAADSHGLLEARGTLKCGAEQVHCTAGGFLKTGLYGYTLECAGDLVAEGGFSIDGGQ
jgi:hypothetical protein